MSEAVVIVTNFLVRVFLSGKMGRDKVFRRIKELKFKFVYGRNQFNELFEVLGYERITKKYNVDRDKLVRFRDWIVRKGVETEPEEFGLCRDPDDNYVIGLAVSYSKTIKTILITSDKDILALKGKIKKVKILTAGEFLAIGD